MAITRDTARSAEHAVRLANEEADRLEVETRAARERAAAAAQESESVAKLWERTENDQRLAAGDELRELKQRADAAIKEKPDEIRPALNDRRYARSMLANYVLGDTMGDPPVLADLRWRELHGFQGLVQAFMGRVGDRAVYDQADDLECRLHREVLKRLHQLAGEE